MTRMIPEPIDTPSLRPAEVAETLGVNLKTVLNAIHEGEIPHTKVGRILLVPTAWVRGRAHLQERTEVAS